MSNDSYLLLLLSDGNLPTGSFVSSSGLESYFKHGFPTTVPVNHPGENNISSPKPPVKIQATVSFIKQSLAAYAHLALPFASDAHEIAIKATSSTEREVLHQIADLDARYEAMTLNHITRRASKAQGVALLTLFSKGFSRPTWIDSLGFEELETVSDARHAALPRHRVFEGIVDAFKLSVRKGETHGHLPICWGVLTASLLLSKGL